jgi:uncharacterized protein (TIGR02231 family)
VTELSSRIVRVRVFEDRAEVERRAEASLPRGVVSVVARGLALTLDDKSVVASCERGGRILATRVRRQVRQVPAADPSRVELLETERRAAAIAHVSAKAAVERAEAELARSSGLAESLVAALRRAPVGFVAGGDRWQAGWQAASGARNAALASVSAAEEKLATAQREQALAEARLAEARLTSPRYESAVELEIEVSDDSVELKLVYRVAAAVWRPEHTARLVDGNAIVWRVAGTIWQRTGEDWSNVACELSTARPAKDASAPQHAEEAV